MHKVILFDLDDTLLDHDSTVHQFLLDQYQRFDALHRVPCDTYCQRFLQLHNHGYVERTFVYSTLQSEFDLTIPLDDLLQDYASRAWQNPTLFPQSMEILSELRRRGYMLGIITNGSIQMQRGKLIASGLAACVDVALISAEERVRKPEPEIFQRAADRLGMHPNECVFIGDNPERDVIGAKRVGMTAVWVKRQLAWPEDIGMCADYVIGELGDLVSLVL